MKTQYKKVFRTSKNVFPCVFDVYFVSFRVIFSFYDVLLSPTMLLCSFLHGLPPVMSLAKFFPFLTESIYGPTYISKIH